MKENYTPSPIDTSDIELSDDVIQLIEVVARQVHEVWAAGRIAAGWNW